MDIPKADEQGEKSEKKLNICCFCNTEMDRPARHYESKHREEAEVKVILGKKDKKERRRLFSELTQKGNWSHNQVVLSSGEGQLCLKKRTKEVGSMSTNDFLPCSYCKQMYNRTYLYKHFNACPKNPDPSGNKGCASNSGKELLPHSYEIQNLAEKQIMLRLSEGKAKDVIKKDTTLLKFINNCIESSFTQGGYKHLRCRVRALSNFLILAREVTNNPGLSFEILLFHLSDLLVSIMKLYTDNFKKYNNLEPLRSDIVKIYEDNIFASNAADMNRKEPLKHALEAFKHSWKRLIRPKANYEKDLKERYKELDLPPSKEVNELYKYICSELEKILSAPILTYTSYRELCKFTLAKITLHNYRRGNEVARMTLEDYKHRSAYDPEKFTDVQLDKFEKLMGSITEIVKLKGKSAAHPTVAAILTPSCIRAIDTILINRDQYIPAANHHAFARRGTVLMHFEGPDMLREITSTAGIRRRDTYLTFTGLRKFCATKFCWMDIPEDKRTLIYQHMGHTANIHKSVYQANADLAKNTIVPTLLFKMLYNINVPKNVTEAEAEDIIYNEMIGLEHTSSPPTSSSSPSSFSVNDELSTSPIPHTSTVSNTFALPDCKFDEIVKETAQKSHEKKKKHRSATNASAVPPSTAAATVASASTATIIATSIPSASSQDKSYFVGDSPSPPDSPSSTLSLSSSQSISSSTHASTFGLLSFENYPSSPISSPLKSITHATLSSVKSSSPFIANPSNFGPLSLVDYPPSPISSPLKSIPHSTLSSVESSSPFIANPSNFGPLPLVDYPPSPISSPYKSIPHATLSSVESSPSFIANPSNIGPLYPPSPSTPSNFVSHTTPSSVKSSFTVSARSNLDSSPPFVHHVDHPIAPSTPSTSSFIHKTPSSVESRFSNKFSPLLIPSIVLRKLGSTPPTTIKRKLFDTPDKDEPITSEDLTDDDSEDEYKPPTKKKSSPVIPKQKFKKLLAQKLAEKKIAQNLKKSQAELVEEKKSPKKRRISPAKLAKQKKSPKKQEKLQGKRVRSDFNYEVSRTSKNSRRPWPPEVRDILAKEFYHELQQKATIENTKMQQVKNKIKKQFPTFSPSSGALRTYLHCNFKKSKTFEKHMEDARRALNL